MSLFNEIMDMVGQCPVISNIDLSKGLTRY